MENIIITIFLITGGFIFVLFAVLVYGLYYLLIQLKYRECLKELCQDINRNYAKKANVTVKKITLSLDKTYNATVSRTNKICISKEYMNAIIKGENSNQDIQYIQLLNTIGHEIAHIKFRDQDYKLFGRMKGNTNKMINLLKEVRADIEGKLIINSSEKDYEKYRLIEEFFEKRNKEDCFRLGYPTEKFRTKYAMNYSPFSKQLIEDVFNDYSEYINTIDRELICKYFEVQ